MISELIGKTFRMELGALKVRVTYESDKQLSFVVDEGAGFVDDGHTETVDIDVTEIRPNVYLTSWTEASGASVTHIEDFENSTLYSKVTIAGQLMNLVGTISGPMPRTRKDIVRAAMRELFEERDVTAVDRYWKEPYLQHSPNMDNGLDGLRSAVPTLNGFSWRPERMVEEGNFVVAHSRVLGWEAEPVIITDIFRFEDDKIAEHWDVVQTEVPAADTASGNPMI